ncbi:RNA polymerase sigma factor [Rhodohalobacter halophilus]|uniref:RNA polymerase sigma factor n=1 Tax=Rhodohalobacter halophilus TaxID=1812810 RepID=UPI00083F5DB8|nr:RNA polymerase sigma factor [Rhodohalobacter halophilus]
MKYLQNGHETSFRVIADQWYPAIYRFAYHYFGNRADAAEIAQKTMIKVHQNLQTLENQDSFKSWIYRIANNLCLDELKRAGRRKSTPLESVSLKNLLDERTPSTELETKELNGAIEKALAELPDDLREVVVLKQFENLTFREIAEILKIPESTAKTRMYNGLNELGSILKRWNINTNYLNRDG